MFLTILAVVGMDQNADKTKYEQNTFTINLKNVEYNDIRSLSEQYRAL